jgi:hypothetical protein
MIVSGVLRTRREIVRNLHTKNAAYARLIFHATNSKTLVLQILRIIHVNDKTTRNQWISTEKLAPIRDVFESIISRFQMAYTTNEHIMTDKS